MNVCNSYILGYITHGYGMAGVPLRWLVVSQSLICSRICCTCKLSPGVVELACRRSIHYVEVIFRTHIFYGFRSLERSLQTPLAEEGDKIRWASSLTYVIAFQQFYCKNLWSTKKSGGMQHHSPTLSAAYIQLQPMEFSRKAFAKSLF